MISKKGNYYIKIFDDELSNVWRLISRIISLKKSKELFYMQINFIIVIILLYGKV
jgi:hypothetical protein